MTSEIQLTPMMAQYRRIKAGLPSDALLLFRLGDFYELFFEDAQAGAQILNVALTKRGLVPMCGIPYHAAAGYITRILKAGRKVAICDQVEDAKPGQLVKREVTQILSPGTHFDERMLADDRNNFLCAVYPSGEQCGLAVIDLTTGDFRATELAIDGALEAELERLRPAELLIPEQSPALRARLQATFPGLNEYEGWAFAPETAVFTLLDHFKVAALDGFGLKGRAAAVGAAGGALHYLIHHLRRSVSNLTRLSCYQTSDLLVLDATTLRTLEILEPTHRDAPKPGSLYAALNRVSTPMGARRLRDWLSQPLAGCVPIARRQEAVQTWIDAPTVLESFRAELKEVRDVERTVSRLSSGSGNARDLASLRQALERFPVLRERVEEAVRTRPSVPDPGLPLEEPVVDGERAPALLAELGAKIDALPEVVELIQRAIVDEPPLGLKDGGLIREGFSAELDVLRQASREGKDWVAKLQQDEIARTGIPSLKVRFNSVFGYYIEVTRANLEKVPESYIRKQTIANGERFITPALKEMESKILGAEERGLRLEYELFQRVRESALERMPVILRASDALGQLDVLAGFAETARLRQYCRPQVRDEGVLLIKDGRHPVLEQSLSQERFVPNDTEMDLERQQMALITGPNMAGKSTYIRQVALLVVLAHTGSFIPAASARVDLVDRVFTRIGASDDLSRGQSTFMVEMSETANILNHATRRSLVVLDEIGRGTSTFDGLSLAWAIVEHLHHQSGAKTLFATHYHELTELAARLPRLRNYNVAAREWQDQIIFLRKILPGGADKSYGIHVARLAGIPAPVLDRAKEILQNLEESELTPEGKVRRPSKHRAEREKLQGLAPSPQMDLFV